MSATQARLEALLDTIEEHLPAYADTNGERLGSVERVITAGAALRDAAPVEYRQGLPPIEAIRAHEARGGWWMARKQRRDQPYNPGLLRFVNLFIDQRGTFIHAAHENDGHYFGVKQLFDWPSNARDLDGYECRPCTEDGAPLSWPVPVPAPEAAR